MRPHSIIRALAATALIALPSLAMAAPDQNTNNNGCPNGQWRNGNGQCVNNGNNGQWNNNGNNGQGNNGNNGRHRHRDRDQEDNNRGDRRDRDDRNNNNGDYNNGGYNNGGYNNGGYNNGGYGNRAGQLSGSVRSFSPYNLYLSNGTHVMLHNGTVINPTGSNLTAGQRVRVIGNWNQDGTFNANEIDVTANGYNRYQR